MEHKVNNSPRLTVDTPAADVIRSTEELEVSDETVYHGVITGVDKINGSGKVLLDEFERPISAKITDPALRQTGNVYTHSLDQDQSIYVKAKATIKNDQIRMLYISDAKVEGFT